jgi:hypothetical protein
MTKNEITYSRLITFVEDAISKGVSLSVICDGKLADSLVEYIILEYPEFADNCQFDKNIEEYYVTFQTFASDLIVTCEFARGKNGMLKEHDIQPCIYFVFTDNYREVYHAVNSDVIAICELTDDEDDVEFDCDEICDCDCDCNDYDEYCDCDECLVEEYTKLIVEASPCPHCIATLLESFAEEIRDNN